MGISEIVGEKLITQKELAEAGVMSRVTQWKERKANRLKYRCIAGKIYYTEANIKDYFAGCGQEQQPNDNENIGGK